MNPSHCNFLCLLVQQHLMQNPHRSGRRHYPDILSCILLFATQFSAHPPIRMMFSLGAGISTSSKSFFSYKDCTDAARSTFHASFRRYQLHDDYFATVKVLNHMWVDQTRIHTHRDIFILIGFQTDTLCNCRIQKSQRIWILPRLYLFHIVPDRYRYPTHQLHQQQ